MRSAAANYLHEYDLRPVDSDIYVTDAVDKGGKMIKALREWEQRRGIVHSFRSKFIEFKPKEIVEEKPKVKQVKDRPIVVPREPMKRGPKPKYTREEKLQLKRERNREYRAKHREVEKERARQWRAKLTPEQRQVIYKKVLAWKAAKRAEKRAAVTSGSAQAS